MPSLEGTFIGLDFGTRYLGIAVGQTITHTSTPLKTLKASTGQFIWQDLDPIIHEWQPKGLVMGLALQPDGSHSTTSLAAKQLGEDLAQRYSLPVYYVEERLTSVTARSMKASPNFSHPDADEDAISASLILESWFHLLQSEKQHA